MSSSSTSRIVAPCRFGLTVSISDLDSSPILCRRWEIDLKGCAVSGFAVDEDVSGALLDDAVNGSQAQAGSLALFLGGEERLEDARHGGFVHAGAGIADGKQNIVSRGMFWCWSTKVSSNRSARFQE